MRGNFGIKLQNSLNLPHIHASFYCNAKEQIKVNREKSEESHISTLRTSLRTFAKLTQKNGGLWVIYVCFSGERVSQNGGCHWKNYTGKWKITSTND